ncbi:hypothetical protein ACFYXH_05340 [Streptomyces sp. NPDC002730]|uniref:hypothetical protein n=1 Tax=Streptomyces sp. NPDC002730 TaxID=3364662 RepID=UPI00367A5561
MAIGRRARFGQPLLFVALLFGIATMHTVGRPVPVHGGGAQRHTAPSPAREHTVPASAVGHTLSSSAVDMTLPGGHHTAGPVNLQNAGPDFPGIGMDLMTLCLAVLDTFTFVLLTAGLLRTDPVALLAAWRARILRALWPNAPLRKTLLARLSVLRI